MNRNYFSLGLVLLLSLIFLGYISNFVQPKIVFNAEVQKISDEDYKRIMNNKQVMSTEKGIEKFRHINIQIKVVTPIVLINHVKIERDFLEQYLKENDKIQILGGGGFEHGNGKEYADNIEIYLKDISDGELRAILKEFKYKVSWQNLRRDQNDKIFYLKDYLR